MTDNFVVFSFDLIARNANEKGFILKVMGDGSVEKNIKISIEYFLFFSYENRYNSHCCFIHFTLTEPRFVEHFYEFFIIWKRVDRFCKIFIGSLIFCNEVSYNW